MVKKFAIYAVCLAATVWAAGAAQAGLVIAGPPSKLDGVPGLTIEFVEESNGLLQLDALSPGMVPGTIVSGDSPTPYRLWQVTLAAGYSFSSLLLQDEYGLKIYGIKFPVENGPTGNFSVTEEGLFLFNWSAPSGTSGAPIVMQVATATPEFASLGIWGALCVGGIAARRFRRKLNSDDLPSGNV